MFRKLLKILNKKDLLKDTSNLRDKFSEIYAKNIFGGKESFSGEGSNMIQTAEIRREIPLLIQNYSIRTFLDAPCGDWFWMCKTSLGVEHYTGIDIVRELIDKNKQIFMNESTNFLCLNLVEDLLTKADLIFCRDCLVHLPFDDIRKIIANFKRSQSSYLLSTTFTDRVSNSDLLRDVFWRPLNLELPPFDFPKPLKIINEKCTEYNGIYADKSLGLWLLDDIKI